MFVYCDSSIAFSAMSCSTYIFRDGLRDHTHVAMAHPSGVGITINPRRKGYGSQSAFVHVSHSMHSTLINPRRMREGYGSRFVSVCVCVSVTTLAATYLVYTLKVGCH